MENVSISLGNNTRVDLSHKTAKLLFLLKDYSPERKIRNKKTTRNQLHFLRIFLNNSQNCQT